MHLHITTNDIKKLIQQSENSNEEKLNFLKSLELSEPESAVSCVLIECKKSTFLLRGVQIKQIYKNSNQNIMKKVIIKTGSVQVEAHIKEPSTKNRELLATDTAAAFPSKDEIVSVINVAYTVFQAVQILWISIKGWFRKPTA